MIFHRCGKIIVQILQTAVGSADLQAIGFQHGLDLFRAVAEETRKFHIPITDFRYLFQG